MSYDYKYISEQMEQMKKLISLNYRNIALVSTGINSRLLDLTQQISEQTEQSRKLINLKYNSAKLTNAVIELGNLLDKLPIPSVDSEQMEKLINLERNIASASIGVAGINARLLNSMQQISEQMKSIDFENIKINNNNTLDYFDTTINIDETVDKVNTSLELEDLSFEEKIEEMTKQSNNNPIIVVILFLFLLIPIVNILNQNNINISNDTSINYEISKSINNLNDDVIYTLDKVANVLGLILMYLNKIGYGIDEFAKEHPGIYGLISYLISGNYKFLKKKQKDIRYSEEIVKDKKRTIKFIRKELTNSVKNEFENPIIYGLFLKNFGVIKHSNVDVRTHDTVKSPIIYRFKNVGEVVIILRKRRNWTKIKFSGEDNRTYIGWVFTRYVDKFD